MSDVLLRGKDITRRWGGLVAVDRVSIELQRGQVHAVIGTNELEQITALNSTTARASTRSRRAPPASPSAPSGTRCGG